MSARKRTPPSPAKFSPSYRAGISPNMAPLKRLDTSESPASRQSRLSCPIESHLSMRGAASSSRIGPNAEASSSKRRGGRLSSAQRGFLSALGNTGKKKVSSSTTTSSTQQQHVGRGVGCGGGGGLPPRSPYRAPVPNFNESQSSINALPAPQQQQRDSAGDVVMGGTSNSNSNSSNDAPSQSPSTHKEGPPAPTASSSPVMQKISRKTVRVQRSVSSSGSKWPRAEDEMLRRLVEQMGVNNWKALSSQMETNRTEEECQARWIKIQHHTRGPWTPEEDARMIELVANMGGAGKIKWSSVAELLPRRVGKQCRERWIII